MSAADKTAVMAAISKINEVEGFDPTPLAVEFADLNTSEKRMRLPVMAQIAWFRLKYPEGRIAVSVVPAKDCFVASARVYRSYADPVDCFLAEASASRGQLPEKPTVSPREWAQTAAVGLALRNAGFGLQFAAAGDSFDTPAVSELGELFGGTDETSGAGDTAQPPAAEAPRAEPMPSEPQAEEDPLEAAMKLPCPISKHKDKTLGDLITADPKALVWVATKYSGDTAVSAAAKLICESAQQAIA